MNINTLKGTGVALVTPFTSGLELDLAGFEALIEHTIKGGVDYLVINGTTGESVTTTAQERQTLLNAAHRVANNRVPLVYGIGGNNTQHVLDTIRQFNFDGISAILSVSPYYNKPSQAGIIQHYTKVADASPVPVILYNVPGRTGSNINAETTLRLANHPNIIGIKEASGNLEQCMHIVKNRPEGFLVISGEDILTVPMISFGMDGAISVLANAFPEKFSQMVNKAMAGNFAEATKLLLGFLDLNPLMYEESNPVGVKAALEQLGVCGKAVRLPLAEATPGLIDKIKKAMY